MKTLIDLGSIPLVNNLKSNNVDSFNAKRYPLKVVADENLTMRLDYQADASEMFDEYLYRSGISEPYKQHCKRMWYDVRHYIYGAVPFIKPSDNPVVVDIGGNDGTLLKCFKSQCNSKVLGELKLINVDASSTFAEDNKSEGIEYIKSFWGDIKLEKKANLIISTNVFQHNSDVHKFLKGIQENLDGVWVLEFPYFLRSVQTNQFDQIYHEHYYYWLITPLAKLFSEYGLNIIDISEHDIHGGTIRIISTNKNVGGHSSIINKYLKEESKFDFDSWGNKINAKLLQDKLFLSNISIQARIACFGAAAKGCVYLNCLDPDFVNKHIMYVVDDTPHKQGKYVPGTKLQVVDRETLYRDQPEYLIIMAHNFKDYIIKSLRPHYKGKIIVLIPDIEIHD